MPFCDSRLCSSMATTWQLETWSLAGSSSGVAYKMISTFPSPDPFIYLIWFFEQGGLLSPLHTLLSYTPHLSPAFPTATSGPPLLAPLFIPPLGGATSPWLSFQSLHACTLRAPLVPRVYLFFNLFVFFFGGGDAVGLCCTTWAFSSCRAQASLVAEHGPWGTRIQ